MDSNENYSHYCMDLVVDTAIFVDADECPKCPNNCSLDI